MLPDILFKVVSVSVDVWITEFMRERGVLSEHYLIPGIHTDLAQ